MNGTRRRCEESDRGVKAAGLASREGGSSASGARRRGGHRGSQELVLTILMTIATLYRAPHHVPNTFLRFFPNLSNWYSNSHFIKKTETQRSYINYSLSHD